MKLEGFGLRFGLYKIKLTIIGGLGDEKCKMFTNRG
jgi:hypothetical protein